MNDWEKEYIGYSMEDAVKRCVKVYGIEGTEGKIKTILNHMPELRDRFLETLHKLYNFG